MSIHRSIHHSIHHGIHHNVLSRVGARKLLKGPAPPEPVQPALVKAATAARGGRPKHHLMSLWLGRDITHADFCLATLKGIQPVSLCLWKFRGNSGNHMGRCNPQSNKWLTVVGSGLYSKTGLQNTFQQMSVSQTNSIFTNDRPQPNHNKMRCHSGATWHLWLAKALKPHILYTIYILILQTLNTFLSKLIILIINSYHYLKILLKRTNH